MTAPAPAWIDRYPHDRALRRRTEVGFWAVVLLVQASFNTVVTWIELRSTTSLGTVCPCRTNPK
ncbi:MAG TPA: hypothetical protein VMA55_17220, partial [Acidovorax sp.]|nr:hypothetical protein [Acidovorax sp.]